MAELSVVIVSYRTPDHLRRCLEALGRDPGRREREILVVDNESGDESPDVARQFPFVRLIETGDNLGFAGGVNRGMAESTGRFITILNPDVEAPPGALDDLADYMEAHPGVGLAAPKLLNDDGSLQYSCRRDYTLSTIVLRRTFLGRLFPNAAPLRRHLMMDYDHASARAVDWVAGAAMMVRREALEDVGPMDDRYFLYFEDVDWCTRMQARGWPVHYVPQVALTHHWQRASKSLGPAARRHLRSGLRFYDRWGGLLHVLRRYRGIWRTLALLSLDLMVVVVAFIGAYLIRQQLAFVLEKPVWPLSFYRGFLAASVLVFLGSFALQGLYREIREGDWVDVTFRVARGATLGALVLMASTYILDMRAYSRLIVAASVPLAVLLAVLGRRVIFDLFVRTRRDRWNLRRVALVGDDPVLDRLERTLRDNPELGWDPIRLRQPAGGAQPADEMGDLLIRQLSGERATEMVVTPGSLGVAEEDLADRLLPIRRAGLGVRVVSAFVAALPARARLERVGDLSWLALERPALETAKLSKRALDLGAAAGLAALGILPFLLLWAGRLVSGKRIWEPNEVWTGRWGETHRVRRLAGGGWFRTYPLLGGVLRGWFSLVGPRPLGPNEETPGGESWIQVRERHRPGLVGPWRLAPASNPEEEMLQELRYLEEWSPELDLKLLARVALHRPGGGKGRGSASPITRTHSKKDTAPAASAPRAHSVGF